MKKAILAIGCLVLLVVVYLLQQHDVDDAPTSTAALAADAWQQDIAIEDDFSVVLQHSAFYVESHQQFTVAIDINNANFRELRVESSNVEGVSASISAGLLRINTQHIEFDKARLVLKFIAGERQVSQHILLVNRTANLAQSSSDTTVADIDASNRHRYDIELSGAVFFERLPFEEYTNDGKTSYRLLLNNAHTYAARFIKINLRDEDDNILASTYTNHLGKYHFSLPDHPSNLQVYLEVLAQMAIPNANGLDVDVRVINHAKAPKKVNQQNIYRQLRDVIALTAGKNVQDVYLNSGWHPTVKTFITSDSAAQPFAILDSLAKGFMFLRQHRVPLPAAPQSLTVLWSQEPAAADTQGAYYRESANHIFINGSNGVDGDEKPIHTISEWNEHTILHEFGHYYLAKIVGRDDSTGGTHYNFGFVSLPVSLSEGLASAISRTVLQDWQMKKAPLDLQSSKITDNTLAISQAKHREKQQYLVDSSGHRYGRPAYAFSPFIEESTSFFIGSLIDENAKYSEYTTKLAQDIGMLELHQALVAAARLPELMTIYSLAQQLKIALPALEYNIDELGFSLNIEFVNGWGAQQGIIESHIVAGNSELLDETAQYPFYSELIADKTLTLQFSGALQSIAPRRPGTVRYAKFSPDNDGAVVIIVHNVSDKKEQQHLFNLDVLLNGKIQGSSRLSKSGRFSYLPLMVQRAETYVIRIFDTSYLDPSYQSSETISSEIVVETRD